MEIYKTSGVCSTEIHFDIADGIIEKVEFVRGCAGNALGIGALIKGMKVEEAIARLKGIDSRGGPDVNTFELTLKLRKTLLNSAAYRLGELLLFLLICFFIKLFQFDEALCTFLVSKCQGLKNILTGGSKFDLVREFADYQLLCTKQLTELFGKLENKISFEG